MRQLGIQEGAFKALSEADRGALYTKIDELHVQLDDALKASDTAKQKTLVQQIGDIQGQINATEGGGYFSGGGTKAMVSIREGFAKGAIDLLPKQKYTALIDQLPKLYAETNTLLRTGYVATEETVGAIKGVAKYAERFSTMTRDMGVGEVNAAAFAELAERFEKLVKQAKGISPSGTTMLERLTTDAEAVRQELEGLMAHFSANSNDLIARLNVQAGMQAAGPVDRMNIQMMVMLTAKLDRTASALNASMTQLITGGMRVGAGAVKDSQAKK
jgi:hypothetical protein